MKAEDAIRTAQLWSTGKLIGGDEDAVREALLVEVERLQALLERLGIYEVKCARCGAVGLTADFIAEEGDEWECPPCWERCEAKERAEAETVVSEWAGQLCFCGKCKRTVLLSGSTAPFKLWGFVCPCGHYTQVGQV